MSMTPMQRVLTTLNHQEPDRVPYFLLTSMQGAQELHLSLKDYYQEAENVFEGQMRLREKYKSDCYYAFYYAPIEIEAFHGEIKYTEDGPYNAGAPIIAKPSDIEHLKVPIINESPGLCKVLKTIRLLKKEAEDRIPIIGVVMSPFSLPVMQMGFDKYLDLMHEDGVLFNQLMQINESFCVDWANSQLEAGATAICYFDPVSSSTIITPKEYEKTGFRIAQRTLAQIKGATATHMASGRCLPIADQISQSGTYAVGVSCEEDLAELKAAFQKKLTVIGNLNGIEMCRWTDDQTEQIVKEAIAKGAKGGGFILSDNHGEIPYQVSDKILIKIRDAVEKWGYYR